MEKQSSNVDTGISFLLTRQIRCKRVSKVTRCEGRHPRTAGHKGFIIPGTLQPARWERGRLQDQEVGELPCHNLAAQNTQKTCILNTDEPSTGGGNYNTNIFLMQNRTNDTYLHDANKVLKNLAFGDTIVIMWFQWRLMPHGELATLYNQDEDSIENALG